MNSEIAGDGTPLRVTHTFTRFQTLGGVESLLQRHLQVDANQGLLSSIRAFFEPLGNVSEGVRGLGCTKWSVPQGARLRMAREASQHPSDVSIYHNCWGSAFAGAVDQSHRRIGLHHSDWPGVEHILRSQNGVLDGMLCIGEAVEQLVRRECPFLADQRCLRLSLPISPPPTLPREIASRRGPIVIGVCGRVPQTSFRCRADWQIVSQ